MGEESTHKEQQSKHLAIRAILDREQVCRRRLHAEIQGWVKMLMCGVNNHCDLTLTTWRGSLLSQSYTDTEGTPDLHSLTFSNLLLSLKNVIEKDWLHF